MAQFATVAAEMIDELSGLAPGAVDKARARARAALFARIAGPDGPRNRERIHTASGARSFAPDSAIHRVHGDCSMFVGGLRALLLQSLHPVAMAAVAAHSGYRGDPWGRLQRTSTFLAVTTFGTERDATRAIDAVRAVHGRISGVTETGPYRASDPRLLNWVHVAEVDSFLRAHQRYGAQPLDEAGCDEYLAQTAMIATKLGADNPPRDRAELQAALCDHRPALRGTREARRTARYLLIHPPVPVLARAPYAVLGASAVGLLPTWARTSLWLPTTPIAERLAVRPAASVLVSTLRWVMHDPTRTPQDTT